MMTKSIIRESLRKMKSESGTHSPSIETMRRSIPDLKINVDACFLSNPYATDLFFNYFKNDLIDSGELVNMLEYYPPQNYDVSKVISSILEINSKNIFVANGAIEVIQAIMHRFVKKKIVVIIPTFSSYYEFKLDDVEVVFYQLRKSENYLLDVDHYIEFIKQEKPDTTIIINPNNPNGGYIEKQDLYKILDELNFVENIVLDESFIHFAYETASHEMINYSDLISTYKNLILIKSMSKDFGIAGIRAGYGVMDEKKVSYLLKNGYLWNISGLAYYFFKTYQNVDFRNKYESVRKKYIIETDKFFNELHNIDGIKVYPSKANFALIEIVKDLSSFDFAINMLVDHGVYTRDCSDKIGLDGKFIRVASRRAHENNIIIDAINESIAEH